jgi:hypothetical protein
MSVTITQISIDGAASYETHAVRSLKSHGFQAREGMCRARLFPRRRAVGRTGDDRDDFSRGLKQVTALNLHEF